jgi:hypothetical protein
MDGTRYKDYIYFTRHPGLGVRCTYVSYLPIDLEEDGRKNNITIRNARQDFDGTLFEHEHARSE